MSSDHLKIGKKQIEKVVEGYTRESGVRGLEKKIAKVVRFAAKSIALEEEYDITLSSEKVEDILGTPRNRDKFENNDVAGVVTGLAWTQVGGDILFIESILSKGKGALSITGNLGTVMKESATIALQYIKSNAEEFGISPEILEKYNVHIHVPEGATPKDGPSAGVGMVTSIVSPITEIPVDKNVAMTGEITLRGIILPIGGLKEKLLAAHRAGIKKVLIHYENKKDLAEIPEIIKKSIDIIPVKNAEDVLKIARRIEYASIFPPNTLDDMQKSIIEFDEVQKKEQGGLRLIDIFLFPTGTIISSGPNCSEQGSGRWLPKPSDTFNKFVLLLQPSIGFKNVPLIWYEMMDVSKIVGFILPDWIADAMPGAYPIHNADGTVTPNFKSKVLSVATGEFKLFKIPVPMGHIWDSFLRVLLGLVLGIIFGVPLGLFMGLNRFAKGFFDPLIELYRPVPPLAWAPLVITVFGIDNVGKIFLLFMVSFSIMIISARAGAAGTQLSKIHASHSLGASKWQILRHVIFPNSLPEILTGVRVAVGMCWGTLVAAEFLAGTTGIGFVENVAKKYFQYEVIWITIFVMGMLGLLFDVALRKIIDKTIPWHGKG